MATGTPDLYVGIDYSLTSPAITECRGEWKYENITHYCLAKNDRQFERWKSFRNIRIEKYPKYNTEMERYLGLSSWVKKCIMKYDVTDQNLHQVVFIEDYAYAAIGQRILQIAENMAILKNTLYNCKLGYKMIPPTVIKKYASDKGNANKELMYDSFVSDTHRKLIDEFQINCDKNPISDIVDSYWICKYGYENGNNT